MEFIDEALRKAGIGVWKTMPEPKQFTRKNNTAGMGRATMENLWRVGSRYELVKKYNSVMKRVYFNLAVAGVSLLGALWAFSTYTSTADVTFAFAAIVFAALVSRHYTKAWGGYAGDWADYESDPVRMIPHHAYVVNEGRGMM
ncbi:MAG: hypothetical protein NTY90_00045 [Candidatus Micrarchaeota archaeon]|nr:hypothetical protein [Candidatus Micrarchaeota archaeon]